ncbi:MAG: methyltransferase type 11 [Hyphomicrobiales bacterium]
MSFSAEWLALREPIDHAARDAGILAAVISLIKGETPARITDIGSGTGSTIRAIEKETKHPIAWHLVDNDAALLKVATAESQNADVKTSLADLSTSLDAVFAHDCDLVTTSAFLDLVSTEWLSGFVDALKKHKKPFYAALTYDGRAGAMPPIGHDDIILNAFNAHQRTDKGFGPALGPDAADTAIEMFSEAGYEVFHSLSDWQAGPADIPFQRMLLEGWQQAANEIRPDLAGDFADWYDMRQKLLIDAENYHPSVFVGHIDFLALPTQ